jgi:hypothetical protein
MWKLVVQTSLNKCQSNLGSDGMSILGK